MAQVVKLRVGMTYHAIESVHVSRCARRAAARPSGGALLRHR